jgi:hypothetical protein
MKGLLELKKRSIFKIELDDPAYGNYNPLYLDGEVTTNTTIIQVINWLAIGLDPSRVGIRHIFTPSSNIKDAPLIPWIPLDT